MRRAQAALEFLILLTGILAVASTAIAAFEYRAAAIQVHVAEREMETVLRVIDIEVRLAGEVQDGYERRFFLPTAIGGASYVIRLAPEKRPSEVVLTSVSGEGVLFLEGELQYGSTLGPGWNVITKSDGGIRIVSE